MPRVGVLALQGDFARHGAALAACGAEPVRVVWPEDLEGLAALVMPGGESTTMLRLIRSNGLRQPLERLVATRPVLGTCAGLILLGKGAQGLPAEPFRALDVDVERNAYGRQIDSFSTDVAMPSLGERPFHAVFIRAPRIRRVGAGVEVLARIGEEAVAVRRGHLVGLCFHPELTDDLRLHRWFLGSVAGLEAAPGPDGAAGATGTAPPGRGRQARRA
jgi:5'-phosphate synthase pdxT subunit